MKNIWIAIKNYNYKMWTTIIITIISSIIYSITEWILFSVIAHLCFIGLVIYLFYIMLFYVVKNTWKDGNKVIAVIFGILVSASFGLLIYLVWTGVLDGYLVI